MRLTQEQARSIGRIARELGGPGAQVRLFGSRLDDDARGGDVDVLVELPDPVANPALLSAKLSAQISRALDGRSVDVLIGAPNLTWLPIHEVARREGRLL